MRLTIAICALSLAIAPAVAQKSRPHHRIAKAVATPLSTHDCGHNLTLHLSSPDATQGSLLLLELRSATQPVAEIKATWDNREIPFWQEPKTDEQSPDVWRALLGVDLELKPENYPLTLTAKTASAEAIPCSATIDVKEGKFATENLKVAPNFGKRRILNGKAGSPHGGVDFPAPAGTPVYAAQRGRVVLAQPLYFSGNTVVLDHGLGLYTFYAHFESISVQPGDLLGTGALLGRVGATGRVTGPHLHWGATVNRARTNPLQLISLPL